MEPLSKEFWMRDSAASSCLKCERPFKVYRRRHHCRYCGLIFCHDCTRKKLPSSKGKLFRSCGPCRESFHNIESPADLIQDYEDLTDITENPCEETLEFLIERKNELLLQELHSFTNTEIEAEAQNYFTLHSHMLISEAEVSSDLEQLILQFVIEVNKKICPSVRLKKDSLDINDHIRVVCVEAKDHSDSKFIHGIVFPESVVHSRMRKQCYFPKILILAGTVDIEEENLIEIFIRKIKRLKPSLVVVEQGISEEVIKEFLLLKITAVQNVKEKILQVLSAATGATIFSSFNRISMENEHLGSCMNFEEVSYDENYLIFERPQYSASAASILFSGPSLSKLKEVKKVFEKLLISYRNVLIEKILLFCSRLELIPHIFFELDSARFSHKEAILKGNKMCKTPTKKIVNYYSSEDEALGRFLVQMAKKAEKKCEIDELHEESDHKIYYFSQTGRVEVRMEKESEVGFYPGIKFEKTCKACGGRKEFRQCLSKVIWEYSFYKFVSNFFTNEKIFHQGRQCLHDYFKQGVFVFTVEKWQVIFEYEENPIFDISPLVLNKPNAKANQRILESSFKELKATGKETLEFLSEQANEIMVLLDKNPEEVQNEHWELLKESMIKEVEEIRKAYSRLENIKIEDFPSHLHVSTVRRKIFLEVSTRKLAIEHIKSSIKRIKQGNKMQFLRAPKLINDSNSHLLPVSASASILEEEKGSVLINRESFKLAKSVSTIDKEDELLMSEAFNTLKKGNLTLPSGVNDLFVAVDEHDSLSIISYTLNSSSYKQEVLSALSNTSDFDKQIELELLRGSEQHFKANFCTYEGEEFDLTGYNNEITRIFGCRRNFHVTVYFPRQFHCMRLKSCGSHEEFVSSISESMSELVELAKKGAFSFSHDKKFIMKVLEEREFRMFIDIAPKYFKHTYKEFFHAMPSLLAQIYGAFKINIKNETTGRNRCDWVLIFGNIGYGLPGSLYTYDLKGTDNNKRKVKTGEKKTKMDLDFLEEMNGIPVTLSVESKRIMDIAVWNDTLFLANQNVVDYSLLVTFSAECRMLKVSIIDYLEEYTFEKAFEYRYKRVTGNEIPTITQANFYKNRFREEIKTRYFMSMSDKEGNTLQFFGILKRGVKRDWSKLKMMEKGFVYTDCFKS